MTKAYVLQQLKQLVKQKLQSGDIVDKKTEKVYSGIMTASEDDLLFGDCPSSFRAYAVCNSTGVGTSSYEGTKTQRTVALDYTTDEYLFVDGHEGAALKALEIFYLEPGETTNYYHKDKLKDVITNYGLQLHLQQFRDLNFTLSSHRLNRYTVKITEETITYPIRPLYLAVEGSKEPVLVGYAYVKDETRYVILDPKEVNLFHNKKSCFSPWMLLGFLFPPLLIIALGVGLYRIATQD